MAFVRGDNEVDHLRTSESLSAVLPPSENRYLRPKTKPQILRARTLAGQGVPGTHPETWNWFTCTTKTTGGTGSYLRTESSLFRVRKGHGGKKERGKKKEVVISRLQSSPLPKWVLDGTVEATIEELSRTTPPQSTVCSSHLSTL